MTTVLALDVGDRRIGIAVSDPTGTFSFPVDALERTAVRDDVRAIVALAQERAVETIVVGDPIRLSGERGPAAEKIDRFVEHLARVWTGRIERVDERLTTAQAQR
ncbi:MAG: Holliday junction resolvase RuvX, partial [Candidatus Eremiobacteraeota bacterium]|nr:Holliday junction resolvase RuvX [Candidatus Eremiobacteraeota bacterium]